MSTVGTVVEAIRRGDYRNAARIMEEAVNSGQLNQRGRVAMAEWIAECYGKLEEHIEAGRWYETAGEFALAAGSPAARVEAAKEYERAQDCYRMAGELDLLRHASARRFQVERGTSQ